jgi:uncharacterized protein (TIGR02646 family)
MVPLDRSGVAAPGNWKAKVEKTLPRRALFWQKARAFERLVLNGPKRREGFNAYTKGVLPDEEYDFPPIWRKVKAVKIALSAMSDGHCAFCQGCVDDNPPGPVEHFKPKSIFPMLAYEIDNYFLSCTPCNLAKSGKWPESGAYLRPDNGDPSRRLAFNERGRVTAAHNDIDAKRTIEDFGLDRVGLRKRRRNAIKGRLKVLRAVLDMPGLQDAQRQKLARVLLKEPLSRFSEAINQNVRRVWCQAFPGLPLR